jgi:hypothetical protein
MAFAAWLLWGPAPALPYALVAAVAVLIIVRPCAAGLETSISIVVGVGRGALGSVRIRGAEDMERFEKVGTLVVDRTSTLAEGQAWGGDCTAGQRPAGRCDSRRRRDEPQFGLGDPPCVAAAWCEDVAPRRCLAHKRRRWSARIRL